MHIGKISGAFRGYEREGKEAEESQIKCRREWTTGRWVTFRVNAAWKKVPRFIKLLPWGRGETVQENLDKMDEKLRPMRAEERSLLVHVVQKISSEKDLTGKTFRCSYMCIVDRQSLSLFETDAIFFLYLFRYNSALKHKLLTPYTKKKLFYRCFDFLLTKKN